MDDSFDGKGEGGRCGQGKTTTTSKQEMAKELYTMACTKLTFLYSEVSCAGLLGSLRVGSIFGLLFQREQLNHGAESAEKGSGCEKKSSLLKYFPEK